MKKTSIHLKYDPEADVLSWEISKSARIDYASEMGNVVVHFTKNHLPALVELLEASQFLKQSEKVVAKARQPLLAQ